MNRKNSNGEKFKCTSRSTLVFSFIEYQIPYSIFATSEMYHLNPSMHVTLISAVAQSSYLVDYVEDKVASLTDIHYEDHHFLLSKKFWI